MQIQIIAEPALLPGIKELETQLRFELAPNGYAIELRRAQGSKMIIDCKEEKAVVLYPCDHLAFKGLSLALEFAKQNRHIEIEPRLENLGTMQDCADGMMSVEGIKEMIRQSAMLGYSYLGLYTEVTYPVEGEPYFGYKTGKFSKGEISEMLRYASLFSIEIVPFVQTLGHMAQLFKWGNYYEISDINNTLLVEFDKTYVLLEKMLKSLRELFATPRISLGMDEAYFMGHGRFHWFVNDRYPSQVDLFLTHLKKVVELANKYGFTQPEIWCDNLFEMEFKGYIYPPKEIFHPWAETVKERIPPNVTFRMWNYALTDKGEFDRCYSLVKGLTKNISFAGICHGYASFAPENKKSRRSVDAIIDGSVSNGINDVLLTRWETIASPLAMIPAFFEYSESACVNSGYSKEERSLFLYGYGYDELYKLDAPNEANFGVSDESVGETNLPFYALADDLLLGINEKHIPESSAYYYAKLEKELFKLSKRDSVLSHVFAFEAELCRVLKEKIPLIFDIRRLYLAKDKDGLREITEKIPSLVDSIRRFYKAYKQEWLTYAKREGFELFELRFGGMMLRIDAVREILLGYINGETDVIPELEEERLPLAPGLENKVICNKDFDGIAVGRKTRL